MRIAYEYKIPDNVYKFTFDVEDEAPEEPVASSTSIPEPNTSNSDNAEPVNKRARLQQDEQSY